MKKLVIVFFVLVTHRLSAQKTFGDACLGNWKGTMYIYARGQLRDSVPVKLTIAKTSTVDAWTWKTAYLSPTMPMVKDYVLRLKDPAKGQYVTDEGDGVELADYCFNNKLYCVFETAGVMLTSTYELRGEELIFEVTSGKKEDSPKGEVINYSTNNLQRVVFKREK
jgi:hypothetical protein